MVCHMKCSSVVFNLRNAILQLMWFPFPLCFSLLFSPLLCSSLPHSLSDSAANRHSSDSVAHTAAVTHLVLQYTIALLNISTYLHPVLNTYKMSSPQSPLNSSSSDS